VTYSPILMNAADLALRTPILRRVYNEMPEIRNAIDKVATMLSQSLMTVGGGSEQVAAFARDLLDVGSTRTYLAHLARDRTDLVDRRIGARAELTCTRSSESAIRPHGREADVTFCDWPSSDAAFWQPVGEPKAPIQKFCA
jgi:hypothetical protein